MIWGIGIASRRPRSLLHVHPDTSRHPGEYGRRYAHRLCRHEHRLVPERSDARDLLPAVAHLLRERENASLLLDFVAVLAVDVGGLDLGLQSALGQLSIHCICDLACDVFPKKRYDVTLNYPSITARYFRTMPYSSAAVRRSSMACAVSASRNCETPPLSPRQNRRLLSAA